METAEIQSWVERLSQDEAESCLAELRVLARQLDSAMDAIVERQLPSLQSSLRMQSATCANLAGIQHRSKQRLKQDDQPEPSAVDPDLAVEIKSATESLLLLNSRYAALIKHSGDTLQLLAGLYRSYRGSMQPGSGMPGNLQTWSCEV
jgi:crotonobetainyl-CoA:carnitine CoA-transferase CaiB-like acyl-CoA transferase